MRLFGLFRALFGRFAVVVVSDHEGARVDGAEVFDGDGDDEEKSGAGEGETLWGASEDDEDVVGDEREHGDEAEGEGAEEVEALDDFFEVVCGLEAWANALDETALLLEVVGNFFGVEVDASVEVGEHDDEEEHGDGVDEPLPSDAERIETGESLSVWRGEEGDELLPEDGVGVATQDDLTDEGGEGEKGGREDDGDDAGGDEL